MDDVSSPKMEKKVRGLNLPDLHVYYLITGTTNQLYTGATEVVIAKIFFAIKTLNWDES
jgi:hypothetical protein